MADTDNPFLPPQSQVAVQNDSAVASTGDAIYDNIMSQIEPELTTAQLPLLDEKYKSETADQAAVRAARYNKAFAEYDKQFADYQTKWNEQFATYKREALKSTEQEARKEDDQQIQSIEQSILAA